MAGTKPGGKIEFTLGASEEKLGLSLDDIIKQSKKKGAANGAAKSSGQAPKVLAQQVGGAQKQRKKAALAVAKASQSKASAAREAKLAEKRGMAPKVVTGAKQRAQQAALQRRISVTQKATNGGRVAKPTTRTKVGALRIDGAGNVKVTIRNPNAQKAVRNVVRTVRNNPLPRPQPVAYAARAGAWGGEAGPSSRGPPGRRMQDAAPVSQSLLYDDAERGSYGPPADDVYAGARGGRGGGPRPYAPRLYQGVDPRQQDPFEAQPVSGRMRSDAILEADRTGSGGLQRAPWGSATYAAERQQREPGGESGSGRRVVRAAPGGGRYQ